MIRLWHLDVSHYNEKARWALDYKRVPHLRRAVPPGVHVPIALVDGAPADAADRDVRRRRRG